MIFPHITAMTAGCILILQMLLAFVVSGARGQNNTWIGDGGKDDLLRAGRRHANLAENGAIFIAGFALLEVSGWRPGILAAMCIAFVAVRIVHAVGLSRRNTNNGFRLVGGVGTYILGFALGGILLWLGLVAAGVK